MPNISGTVSDIEAGNSNLVLRATRMAVLIAPEGTAAISTIVDGTSGGNLSIPDTYQSVGFLEKSDGLAIAPKIDTSPSEAYGETQPIAYYVTGSTTTATFTMKESKKAVLDAYYAMDLSAVAADATTGEVTFDLPDTPAVRYPRLLVIGQHRQGADAVYIGHLFPRVMITDIAEQDYKDDGDVVYKVTYTALVDAALGTAHRPFYSGPGMSALASEMGF